MPDTVRMHVPKTAEVPVRRIEVFTGTGRRRKWSPEEKAAILAESYNSADSVCAVARRHGLTHSQLFGWRRSARRAQAKTDAPVFVPAVSCAGPSAVAAPEAIEIEFKGVKLRIPGGTRPSTIMALLKALRPKR